MPSSQPLDFPATFGLHLRSHMSLTYSMTGSKRVKEGLWVASFSLQLKSVLSRLLSSKPPPPEIYPPISIHPCTSYVSFLPTPNNAIRKSFLLSSDLGLWGTGTHHGFPVFLSHLEALLSLFISLGEESKNGGMGSQKPHRNSHSPSRIMMIIPHKGMSLLNEECLLLPVQQRVASATGPRGVLSPQK